jgi:hypothetical protein
MNLVLKTPKHHRLIHLFAGVDSFNDQMAEDIRNIDQAPPGMPPLKSPTEIKGMLCLFKDIEEDEDRPVG